MAGTIVADTIQNGTGTSTSMDNAINGSAKAWVRFNGTTASPSTINGSYNVTSVTKNSTGDYTINFTNAMSSANFGAAGMCGYYSVAAGFVSWTGGSTDTVVSSNIRIQTYQANGGAVVDFSKVSVVVFSS